MYIYIYRDYKQAIYIHIYVYIQGLYQIDAGQRTGEVSRTSRMKALEIHRFRRSKPTFRRFQGDSLLTGSLNGLPFSSFVDSKQFSLHTKSCVSFGCVVKA